MYKAFKGKWQAFGDKPVISIDIWNSQYGQYIGDLLPVKAGHRR